MPIRSEMMEEEEGGQEEESGSGRSTAQDHLCNTRGVGMMIAHPV